MANTFENTDVTFATGMRGGSTMPRYQRKAMEKAQLADRFIPNRSGMNLDACRHSLLDVNSTETASPSKTDYARSVKANIADESNSKILAFKQQAPKPVAGFQAKHTVLYSQARSDKARVNKAVTRFIAQTPERVLDAPELKADYYLNLLEWSSQNMIAVALADMVYLWDAGSGSISELCQVSATEEYVSSVSWVADGSYLAVGTANNKVQVWDVAAQKKVRSMYSDGGRIAAMAWNNHVLSTGSRGGKIYNHDVRVQQHHFQTLDNHTQEVCGLKWSPDGKYLASGGNDNVINIWDANGRNTQSFTDHTAAVKALAWCPWQSNLLATGGGTADRTIKFRNVASGATVNTIDTKSQVSSLQWNKEHREIISSHGFSENQLNIWKYPTLEKVTELTGHTERILSTAVSPDGTTVVSAGADETLRFWKCFAKDETKKNKKERTGASGASKLTASLR